MQSIAIIFGDNDFDNTFRSLLTTLARAIEHSGSYLSQGDITLILRQGADFHYLAFQAPGGLYPLPQVPHEAKGYDLDKFKVLFDDEADHAFQHEDHNHGAWHLHIPSGQINSF